MTHVPVVMNYIIERLRSRQYGESEPYTLESEAADAIEALQARVKKAEDEEHESQWNLERACRKADAALARVTELEERLDCDRAILAARTASMERYMEERDAALAKLDALEKQAPVATIGSTAFNVYYQSNGHSWLEPAGSKTVMYFKELPIGTTLYASPVPAKTLSEEEIEKCVERVWGSYADFDEIRVFVRYVETALKGGA